MRIWTSRFSNKELAQREDLVKVRTTVGAPKMPLAFPLEECKSLAPYGAFHKPNWRELYLERLERIGVQEINAQLCALSARNGGRDLVLLCYEDVHRDGDGACHRRLFAEWWFDKTGEVIDELPPPTLRHPIPPDHDNAPGHQLGLL